MATTLDELQAAQDAADRAAYEHAPNAKELQAHASRLRATDAMQNWAYRNLTAKGADLNAMAARMSTGYGIPVDELREVAMTVYRDYWRD